ncbi:hypothetical protein SMGD1_0298 [Sulfurimonas gotlandica GD1]|jgi:cellulose synthase/poly-beta-1,6-N-acetylglucosamine synthase-like glycosyltransferase|uniref:Uncharacterized protein n=1 Tax=Sulfurimonas gotlandica (strain DSM 19862 / JCM 16533 / GD1) TaxID=929558 RepID=B6BNM1_SULGG|nr:hypothetical protein [Sulfurimonas gotlandica]EDZ61279.1 hypothetical protein CBGD1_104 [Sulfurimonas gotlandica GD1]EHP28825.1 hypothetical protein SMGD1_0298 [Sulfurimonas gotlandica GD1]
MEFENDQHNMIYYNQILRAEQKKKSPKKKKPTSFTKQEVNFKDYLYVPEGLEPLIYTFYIVGIPYLVGTIFLFFTIAGADFANFKLLDVSAFFIVWAIGYEITATLLLISIFVMFLKHDGDSD